MLRFLAVLIVLSLAPYAQAEMGEEAQLLEILDADQPRDRCITRGLAWLRSEQRGDGSLGEDHRTALTALAVTAHLASGHPIYDPDHGPWLQRSLRYVLDQQDASGYFGKADGSRMYGHGITTLMLAEALGMCGDPGLEEAIRRALVQAVAVTVNAARVKKSEDHRGGWRYHPSDDKSDLSLSGWQLMSLHAVQQVGITVPEEVVADAVAYAMRLTDGEGRVGYQKRGEDKPALRGLGALCFVIGGESEHERVDKIVLRIRRDPIEWKGPWFFYRAYYDAVGMSRARPAAWAQYREQVESVLMEHQHEDGYWPAPPGDNEAKHGRVYTTSMALLALAVERNVLPAYQR